MRLRHLTASDYAVQPWKNGGGITTQIAVDADGNRWRWRVSVAEVRQSGPFSDFAECDRIIMLIAGDGMLLSFDGMPARCVDAPFRPFTFDGDAKTDCRLLGGPVRDLNLMVDRAYGLGAMEAKVVDAATVPVLLQGDCDLLYCAIGRADAIVADERNGLAQGDTLRVDGGAGLPLVLHPVYDCAPASTIVHMYVRAL